MVAISISSCSDRDVRPDRKSECLEIDALILFPFLLHSGRWMSRKGPIDTPNAKETVVMNPIA